MSADRRPLGLPDFSAPAVDAPVAGRRPLPPVDRALFLPPPVEEPVAERPARRPLTVGAMAFRAPGA
ncbi:hypothetical protein KNE206_62640 [Kitasatospora sp. NE20-6]|uniref:hypothetical protein n=1 Tax=Kitasatospora sp. NE20-6 TaxID=2859066 RepID=UPI0034DC6FBD